MSFFPSSRNFAMDHPMFINAHNYVQAHGQVHGRYSDKDAFDKLYQQAAVEAIHNSDERCDAPKVHPETRRAVQDEILHWIYYGGGDLDRENILWMSGPAGAGKTAIAGAIAELCERQGLLAGSFFFSSYSRSEKRRTKKGLIATLVYCLLQHDGMQPLRRDILSAIERDPGVFRKTLMEQCMTLLLRPLSNARNRLDPSAIPRVFILDGLDEVEAKGARTLAPHEARRANENDQVEILIALLQAAQDPRFPFRIIVVSRPEHAIRDFFSTRGSPVTRGIFLDDKYNPNSDIALFLCAKFAEIRRRYRMAAAWPQEWQIKQLVENASGQFIYPATVVRFLESGNRPNPQAILATILNTDCPDPSLDALAPLDALYSRILRLSPDLPLALRWISVSQLKGDDYLPALFVRQLLQDFDGQEGYLLENLSSLINIPPPGDRKSPYQIYHKSLLDFLGSAERCGQPLKDSFEDGPAFFSDRWIRVLKTGSPVVPIMGSEWPDFVETFLLVVAQETGGFLDHLKEHHSYETDVATTCDVGAWVRTVDAAFMAEPDRASEILNSIYHNIHFQCILGSGGSYVLREDPTIRCVEVCRHWRSNIIGECTSLGWAVPNLISRFCEWFWWMVGESADELEDMAPDFKPPTIRSQPLVPPPHNIVELQARQKVYLDEYRAQCEIIIFIWNSLPASWDDISFAVDTAKEYKPFLSELRKLLRLLAPDVRLRMEGLDAWLQPSEEYDQEDETSSDGANEGEGSDDERSEEGRDSHMGTHLPSHAMAAGYSQAFERVNSSFADLRIADRSSGRSMAPSTLARNQRGSGAYYNMQFVPPVQEQYPGSHLPPQSFPSPPSGYGARSWNDGTGATHTNWNPPVAGPSNIIPPKLTFDVPMNGSESNEEGYY